MLVGLLVLLVLRFVAGCAQGSTASPDLASASDGNLIFPDGCTPACQGLACGASDGCGGTCQTGSCPGKETCVAGTCKDCDRWVASLPGPLRAVAIAGDGTIYAAGAKQDQALFASLDRCGAVKKTVTHLPTDATKVSVSGLALSAGVLHAAGSLVPKTKDPQDGMWAQLSTPDLAISWMSKLTGSTGKDEVWDIVDAGGALWMSGSADFEVASRAWGVKGVQTQACGFSWLGTGQGNGRRIYAHSASARVYFTGSQGGKGFVAWQSDTACTVSPCGACAAPWSTTFQDGTNSTEGRALYVAGNDLYVAGPASAAGDYRSVVFRIDLTTGKTLDTFVYNPTPDLDMPLALASDGKALYLAGVQGYTSPITAAVKAVVIKLTTPDLKQVWVRVKDPGAYWDVKLVGADGLLLAGEDSQGGGMIRRCLTDGTGC